MRKRKANKRRFIEMRARQLSRITTIKNLDLRIQSLKRAIIRQTEMLQEKPWLKNSIAKMSIQKDLLQYQFDNWHDCVAKGLIKML